jgi:hypothetical protein
MRVKVESKTKIVEVRSYLCDICDFEGSRECEIEHHFNIAHTWADYIEVNGYDFYKFETLDNYIKFTKAKGIRCDDFKEPGWYCIYAWTDSDGDDRCRIMSKENMIYHLESKIGDLEEEINELKQKIEEKNTAIATITREVGNATHADQLENKI